MLRPINVGTKFRDILIVYHAIVPFLYTNNCKHALSIEHVVPVRILKKIGQGKEAAIVDPYNLHLTTQKYNSLRSDYIFFLPGKTLRESLEKDSHFVKTFKDAGSGCLISHKFRVFVPRLQDYAIISRSALHCQKKYGIDCKQVVLGGEGVAHFWANKPLDGREKVHHTLAKFWTVWGKRGCNGKSNVQDSE